jgi:hypothetical protein
MDDGRGVQPPSRLIPDTVPKQQECDARRRQGQEYVYAYPASLTLNIAFSMHRGYEIFWNVQSSTFGGFRVKGFELRRVGNNFDWFTKFSRVPRKIWILRPGDATAKRHLWSYLLNLCCHFWMTAFHTSLPRHVLVEERLPWTV